MQSRSNPDLDDFLAGVPTTGDDNTRLQSVRSLDRLDPHQYLAFLKQFSEKHPPTRSIPPRHEPFRL